MPDISVNPFNINNDMNNEKNISERAKKMSGFTARGTRIAKPGEDMDKNAFLRILSAELSNQDPMNAKDGTEFVTQMAQFSGLEQMANLNTTMRLSGAVSFVNKYVMLNKFDKYGDISQGLVTGISREGDKIKLNVLTGEERGKDGELLTIVKQFNVEDVIELVNMPTNNTKNNEINKNKIKAI